jgi:2-polyprenyl-3-methyl-5-hydroxy-6-metoxy-1,4-benzoquinol methylase
MLENILKCKICEASLTKTFKVKEMMLGTRDEFDYGQCPECDTIQIIDVPDSIANYYPYYYYSFKQRVPSLKLKSLIKRKFADFRMKRKYKKSNVDFLKYLKPLQILPSHKILDVGCGKGKLICEMFNYGFENVEGVDKFILEEYDYNYNVKVFKKELTELEPNSYDLLMLHHSFEHMDQPFEELRNCYELLKPGGHLLIRIPVVGEAWKTYGVDWIQLDAPRHFFIHSEKSMQLLAKKARFNIVDVVYDSSSFQFIGSEMYKRGIPLVDDLTKVYRDVGPIFTDEEHKNYEDQAQQLNRERKGDQAIFYLRK